MNKQDATLVQETTQEEEEEEEEEEEHHTPALRLALWCAARLTQGRR